MAGSVLAAAAAPVLFVQYGNGYFRWIGPFRWRGVAAVPLRLFTYSFSSVPIGPVLSASAIVVISIGGIHLGRRSAGGRLVLLLAFGPIAAAAVAWAGGMPIFDLRNLIGIGAYVAVLTVGALDALSHRLRAVAAVGVVTAIAASLAVSNANRIPPYDGMAHLLVEQGWTASQPILVYGDPYRYRLPFEWYLPRRPVLDMSRVLDGTCAEVFVVTPRGKVERERLGGNASLHQRTLLVDPQHLPQCVELGRHAAAPV
jgi:hypothetical protein